MQRKTWGADASARVASERSAILRRRNSPPQCEHERMRRRFRRMTVLGFGGSLGALQRQFLDRERRAIRAASGCLGRPQSAREMIRHAGHRPTRLPLPAARRRNSIWNPRGPWLQFKQRRTGRLEIEADRSPQGAHAPQSDALSRRNRTALLHKMSAFCSALRKSAPNTASIPAAASSGKSEPNMMRLPKPASIKPRRWR
jgi:hypothetical protein